MRLELAQQSIDLAPGQQAAVDVRVENTGAEPMDAVVGVSGLDGGGARQVARLGVLAPGALVSTTLQFALPVESSAGVREIAVHLEARPLQQLRGAAVDAGLVRRTANLRLRVGSTALLSLRLARAEVHGRFRGKLRADLRNQGVEPVTLDLSGTGEGVTVRFDRAQLTLPPGHSARVRGTVSKPGVTWRREHRRAFVVTAQGATTPATTSGSYVQRGLLPSSVVKLVAVLLVLCLWIGGLVWISQDVGPGASLHGTVALNSATDLSGSSGTAGDGSGTTGGTAGADGSGDPSGAGGSGGEGSGAGGGEGAGGAADALAGTKVAVSLLGSVDGPSDRSGTQAVLDMISLGPSTSGSGEPTKLAALTSVRHAIAPLSPTQRTSTDETGKFRFDDILETPALFRLTVFRDGFDVASEVVNIDGSKPNVELAIKLSPAAGVLAGRVVDSSGAALGGATITVTSSGTSSGTTVGAESGDLNYSATSDDATGAWRLDGVATPATYVVRITKDSYASASLIVTLDGGGTSTGLDASLQQGVGTVHGLVRSGADGVGALTVTLTSSTQTFATTTRTTDPVGFFELPGVPLGVYSLDISGDGWQPSARQVVVDGGDIDLGMISDMARSTATISGLARQQVVDSRNGDGTTSTCVFPKSSDDPGIRLSPCGGVAVVATNGDQTYRTTSSSGDGSFLLSAVPPGSYSMSFARAGYSTVLFTATVAAGDNLDLPTTDLTMVPTTADATGSVRMFVVSAANLALTGITVQVVGQQPAPLPAASAGAGATPVVIEGLLPGTYNVRVSADEHDTATVQVQIPLAAQVNAGTVVLTPLASFGGQVNGFQSRPVPGAVVFVTPDPTDPSSASLLVVPRGTPEVPDGASLDADPAVGEVRLCRRDVAAAGAPADVRTGVCTRSNNLGRYDFIRLMRTGRYLVFAPMNNVVDASSETALDHAVRQFNVATTVGQQSNLDLALVRFGAVVGTVRTPDPATGTDFQTVDGVEITATYCQPSSGPTGCAVPPTQAVFQDPRGRSSYGDNGTFRIDRLTPPGFDVATGVTVTNYLVRFHKDGFVDQYRSVTAPALNEERQLDVVMLPKPTRVAITPYWTKAGTTAPVPVQGATVTISGIVDYTTSPLAAVPGSAVGPPGASGAFDSGSVNCPTPQSAVPPPCTFKSGAITVQVDAPGFATATATVSIDPTSTDPTTLDGVTFVPDPAVDGQTLLTANIRLDAQPQPVSGNLLPRCCTTAVNGSSAIPPLSPSAATAVLASIQARLTVGSNPAVTLVTPIGADGNYTFGSVAPGAYVLTFEVTGPDPNLLAGHVEMPAPLAVELRPAFATTVPQRVATLVKATIAGTITDADNGLPLPGAVVTIPNVSSTFGIPGPLSATTNSAGAFSIDVWDVPRSLAIVISKSDGRQTVNYAEQLFTPGAQIRFDQALNGPRGTISGAVRGVDNPGVGSQALEGATVELRKVDGTVVRTTTAGAGGIYTIGDIVASNAGVPYRLFFTMPGYDALGPVAINVVTGANNVPAVEMQASARTVTVQVVSATTANGVDVPLGGVTVTATASGNSPVSAVTTAAGTVTLPLRPGTWSLTTSGAATASAVGFPVTIHRDKSDTVTVPVGEGAHQGPTIRLTGPFGAATVAVSGRLNPASTPVIIVGAVVTLTSPDGTRTVRATTDGNGNYDFAATIPVVFAASTPYNITVTAPGYANHGPVGVQILASGVTQLAPIELAAAPQQARIRVVGAEAGAPALGGVTVTATLRGTSSRVLGTTVAGVVDLALQPGTWDLVTSGGLAATIGTTPSPHGDTSGAVAVVLGAAPPETTLVMSVLVAFSGHVVSQSGGDIPGVPTSDLEGAAITLTRVNVPVPAPPVTVYRGTTGADGTYSIFLAPGTYVLTATALGYNSFSELNPIEVPEAGISGHDFTMTQQALTIRGRVLTTTGTVGVRDVKVTFTATAGSTTYTASVLTQADGSYQYQVPASMMWTVAFDASTSQDLNAQRVPVLYRYVGPTNGGVTVVLDHRTYATLVTLAVSVKGVLPGCTAPCAITHDLTTAAGVSLTDAGTAVAGRTAVVTFNPLSTTAVGGVQTGEFTNVPLLANLTVAVTAPGYGGASLPVNLLTLPNSCPGAPANRRCVEIDLTALARPVHVTARDDSGTAIAGAVVSFRPQPPNTGTALTCTTNAGGECTTAEMAPAFGTAPHYDLVVDPAITDVQHGQLITDFSLPAGTGAFDVVVADVPRVPVVQDPTAVAAWQGDNAVFSANAAGTLPMTAQWQRSEDGTTWIDSGTSAPVNGSGGTTHTVTAVSVAQDGDQYRVVFTNGGGNGATASTRTSAAATLTVHGDPAITVQPADLTLDDAAAGSITAEASGPSGAPATATWQSSPDGTTWTAVSPQPATTTVAGTASSTLPVPASAAGGTRYRVSFSFAPTGVAPRSTAQSTVATLTRNPPPTTSTTSTTSTTTTPTTTTSTTTTVATTTTEAATTTTEAATTTPSSSTTTTVAE